MSQSDPRARKNDPRTRKDGTCTVCKGRKPSPPKIATKRDKQLLLKHLAEDPFCSTTCCRVWHGCVLGAATIGLEVAA